jgi:ribosome maturation factor RimP
MMAKTNQLNRMIDQYCKIVIKEPGDKKAHVITGTIQKIDNQTKCMIVKSYNGSHCLSLEAIVAIKPKRMYDA